MYVALGVIIANLCVAMSVSLSFLLYVSLNSPIVLYIFSLPLPCTCKTSLNYSYLDCLKGIPLCSFMALHFVTSNILLAYYFGDMIFVKQFFRKFKKKKHKYIPCFSIFVICQWILYKEVMFKGYIENLDIYDYEFRGIGTTNY